MVEKNPVQKSAVFAGMLAVVCAALACPVAPAHASAQVNVTNFSDLALGSWGLGDPDIKGHIDLCVYASGNSPAGGYAVTASAPGGFVLKNGTQNLPFSVSWDDGGAGNLGITSASLSSSSKLSAQVNANTASSTCLLSQPTARLNVTVSHLDLTAALAGTYSATITVTLSPN